jgi:hypothetical protein
VVPTFFEVTPPALPAQNAVNLLASAESPQGDGDGWQAGLVWVSDGCPDWQGFSPCAELDEAPPLGSAGPVYAVPVGYRVSHECSTLSGRFEQERARVQAERIASYVAARELWTGTLSKLDPYDLPNGGPLNQVNPHLASPSATSLPAETDIMAALGELEGAAGDALLGGPVFIHAPVRLVARVGQNLERVGNELRTKTGAVIIPDAGYPGTGPAGTGTGWMYGTGPVVVRLGAVTSDIEPSTTTDRKTNLRRAIAERMFGVAFDPCTHFAIQVTGE